MVNLICSWISFPSAISYMILLIIAFNTSLEFLGSASASKKNAYEIAQSIRNTLYYIWGSIMYEKSLIFCKSKISRESNLIIFFQTNDRYFTFITRADSFLNIFKAWRDCSVVYTKPDIKLNRDVIIISVLILVSGTLENATLYSGYVKDMLFPGNGRFCKLTYNATEIFTMICKL